MALAHLRTAPPDVARRYRDAGWWNDDTLGDTVTTGLARSADVGFAVHSKTRPWRGTFGAVDRMARSLAASLHGRGVGPGDVVVVQLPNWMEAAVAFWATAYLGAVVVPVVHFYGAKEVGYIVNAIDPDVVIGSTAQVAMHEELLRDGDRLWLVVGDDDALPKAATPFTAMLDADPLPERLEVDPDAPTLIAFTSGTTRDPKGVVHSHRTLGCETRHIANMTPVDGPPGITAAPVGHFIGMVNAFLTPLLRDYPVNLVDVWDPGEVLRIMREEQIGMGGGATYFLISLLDHPDFDEAVHLPLMPFAGLGGSPVPMAVMERAARLGIRAFRSYGSTEHPSITACTLDDPLDKRNTTDGRPLEGVEMRLDESGEILSKGPDQFIGYTDPELTARVFDDDGWYRTGDVGVLDDEGYLSITDRVSDVIIRGGENVSAQEVEELLMGLDHVAEVAVVAEPDPRLGERVAAVVRLQEGASGPTLEDVRAHLGNIGLAKQKWPESIYQVRDFPRTASGKVQKYVLRNLLKHGQL
jgi:acyl-CoA synthetase (AMP-forming)/AMP-acid ligase II